LDDDGFSLGVIFRGERAALPKDLDATATVKQIEQRFAIA
jgi:hypothetical protein